MRSYRLFSLLILGLMLVSGSITLAQDSAPQLRDLPVFADQRYGMWAGSGDGLTLSVEDGSLLPIDEAMTRDGLPSLRIDVSGACCGGWWAAILAGENWETYDLRPYVANGALEFNIHGSANIDNFAINLRDHVNTRATAEQDAAEVNLAEYIRLTDDWQAVRIPLQAFVTGTDFEPRQMAILSIGSAGDATGTLWINNLRFTSPDAEPQFPAIKINQVGYPPDGQKMPW
ncbi:MAG: hypothetical protein CL607_28345 [Anaerolineaceae bacterium]|nr:hypothetical protein [Anaerolineaceae bacterium]